MRSTTRRERKPKSEVLPKKASYYDGLDAAQDEFNNSESEKAMERFLVEQGFLKPEPNEPEE